MLINNKTRIVLINVYYELLHFYWYLVCSTYIRCAYENVFFQTMCIKYKYRLEKI